VGGKTGVDTPAGKNLVGAFHQPAAVLMDPLVLRTLPDREFRTGLAEAVKHAVIDSEEHAQWLGSAADAILARDPVALEQLLRRSLAVKVSVVEEDETEQGRRAVLNAGHTVGHALEAASNYSLSHGEAVALGLIAEAELGERLGITESGTARSLEELLRRFGALPHGSAHWSAEAVMTAMRADKKNRAGAIRMALLARIGAVASPGGTAWTQPVPDEAIREMLAAVSREPRAESREPGA
jgi:3-dehydroquinate synthase